MNFGSTDSVPQMMKWAYLVLLVGVACNKFKDNPLESPRVLGVIGCMQQCRSMCRCSQFRYYHSDKTCVINTGSSDPAWKNGNCSQTYERCIEARSGVSLCTPSGVLQK